MYKGYDISSIQGSNIDFNAMVTDGISFIIHRCYVGNGYKDPMYDGNIAKAKAAGLKVACYHFVYPLPTIPSQPTRDPKVQAKMHAASAGDVPVVFCDLEWPSQQDWATKWNCTAAQIVQWTIDYLEEYENLTGIRPIVYTYPSFASAIKLPADFAQKYKLWIASYTTAPVSVAPWGADWTLWQSSGGSQKLPNGVAVDIDYAKDLSLWDAVVPAAPPSPQPDVAPPVDNTPPPPPVVVVPPPPAPVPVPNVPSVWQTIMGVLGKLFK